jgi:hypothetical protein
MPPHDGLPHCKVESVELAKEEIGPFEETDVKFSISRKDLIFGVTVRRWQSDSHSFPELRCFSSIQSLHCVHTRCPLQTPRPSVDGEEARGSRAELMLSLIAYRVSLSY